MMTDARKAYCGGDHCAICTNLKLLCYTPEPQKFKKQNNSCLSSA